MTRREIAIERFANAIGRLEDAQNSEVLKHILDEAGVQNLVNEAKSKLLRVLSRIESV